VIVASESNRLQHFGESENYFEKALAGLPEWGPPGCNYADFSFCLRVSKISI
jgi:hypothetical protein